MKNLRRIVQAGVILILTALAIPTAALAAGAGALGLVPAYQDDEPTTFPDARALVTLQNLTPEERVGQLFVVTFEGTDVSTESEIWDLIVNHHIGGVILEAENDNFVGGELTVQSLSQLILELQQAEWDGSRMDQTGEIATLADQPSYVPLFIGTVQEGNGFPHDQILNGLSPLPSPLAIGATWDPSLARAVGRVLGEELAAVGINMLLGPSVDVLESPSPDGPGDLGIRTFGGDPYWVSEMGRAFVTGVHEGSSNRVALIAKHFPGHGGSDRQPEEEVATVRKGIEQLKQIELPPFFAVTGDAPSAEAAVEGLLSSHIRYQGLQGNIRATTNPFSFDPQAFNLLMGLEPFVIWRDEGGLVVSDDLGSRAVRRFYDPEGQTFNARIVALNAFLAGNDVLFLGEVASGNDPSNAVAILRVIEFFSQKYREDPAFAERVDQSVLRILGLKHKLYDDFNLATVSSGSPDLDLIGSQTQITFEVARQSATLINPPSSELDNLLPEPPALNDRMVIFTDAYAAKQCTVCEDRPVIPVDALQQAVINLYGPDAGDQILPFNIVSFSFQALTDVLNQGPRNTIVEQTLRSADWIVFMALDVDENRPSSLALRRFLDEQSNIYRNKRLIVFALDAPYLLDATDISKITAYYGLYSKSPQFVEVAARLLFKELRPIPGALPVSVPGIGYDLITATSPDPEQVFQLFMERPESVASAGTPTAVAPEQEEFRVGDRVAVRTSIILDRNGNPVPDGTPVLFFLTIDGQEISPQVDTTVGGVAGTTLVLEERGAILIAARTGDPPASSEPIRINIPVDEQETTATIPATTPDASETPEPSETPPEPTPAPTPVPPASDSPRTDLGDWFLAIAVTFVVGLAAYRTGDAAGEIRWAVRWGLCTALGGLLVYIGLSLSFPGTEWLLSTWNRWAVILLSIGGAGIGWLVGILWRSVDLR